MNCTAIIIGLAGSSIHPPEFALCLGLSNKLVIDSYLLLILLEKVIGAFSLSAAAKCPNSGIVHIGQCLANTPHAAVAALVIETTSIVSALPVLMVLVSRDRNIYTDSVLKLLSTFSLPASVNLFWAL